MWTRREAEEFEHGGNYSMLALHCQQYCNYSKSWNYFQDIINDTENFSHTPKFTKALVPAIRPDLGTTLCIGIIWYLCEMT